MFSRSSNKRRKVMTVKVIESAKDENGEKKAIDLSKAKITIIEPIADLKKDKKGEDK